MTVQLVMGIVADIAMLIAISSPVATILGATTSVAFPGLIVILVACASCCLRKRGSLRFLPLLALPLAYLFVLQIIVGFWITPMIVYVIVMTCRGAYGGLFDEFYDLFKVATVVTTLFAVAANNLAIANGGDNGAFLYALVFLCAGFVRLRCMRQTSSVLHNMPLFHVDNFISIFALILASGALTGALYGFYALIRKLAPVIDIQGGVAPTRIPFSTREPYEQPRATNPPALETESPLSPLRESPDMLVPQIIVACLALLAITLFIARRIKKRVENKPHGDALRVLGETRDSNRLHRGSNDKANRDSVRRIYKRLLKFLDSHDMTVLHYYTSDDVNRLLKNASRLYSLCDQMRAVYILARYDSEAIISRAHVALMRELYADIKRGL